MIISELVQPLMAAIRFPALASQKKNTSYLAEPSSNAPFNELVMEQRFIGGVLWFILKSLKAK